VQLLVNEQYIDSIMHGATIKVTNFMFERIQNLGALKNMKRRIGCALSKVTCIYNRL